MKTVRKALAILESFSLETKYQGVTEISKKLGFHKSTTHAILNTLKDEGYIIYEPDTKKYSLGFKILRLSKIIAYQSELRSYALPIMEDLSKKCEEDIALNILVEGRRVCIELVESRYFVRQFVPIGKALPLHCSAAGKAMLAYLTEDQVNNIIRKYGLERFTDNTITDVDVLRRELNLIRERGFAVSYEEYGKDAASIGFPLFNQKGQIIGSLSIQTIITRITEETKKNFIRYGREAANRINEFLALGDGR